MSTLYYFDGGRWINISNILLTFYTILLILCIITDVAQNWVTTNIVFKNIMLILEQFNQYGMLQSHSIRDTGYFRHQYTLWYRVIWFPKNTDYGERNKVLKLRTYLEKSITAKTYSYSLSRFIQERGSKLKIINKTKIDFEFSLVIEHK